MLRGVNCQISEGERVNIIQINCVSDISILHEILIKTYNSRIDSDVVHSYIERLRQKHLI